MRTYVVLVTQQTTQCLLVDKQVIHLCHAFSHVENTTMKLRYTSCHVARSHPIANKGINTLASMFSQCVLITHHFLAVEFPFQLDETSVDNSICVFQSVFCDWNPHFFCQNFHMILNHWLYTVLICFVWNYCIYCTHDWNSHMVSPEHGIVSITGVPWNLLLWSFPKQKHAIPSYPLVMTNIANWKKHDF